jgi:hypothetical protein
MAVSILGLNHAVGNAIKGSRHDPHVGYLIAHYLNPARTIILKCD